METVTDKEAAYIAGFFDGEGSVGFHWVKNSKTGKRNGKLLARLAQNSKPVLEWVVKTMGVGSVTKSKANGGGENPCYHYQVANAAARKFLRTIRPYLIVKAERVDEMLALDTLHCKPRKII